MSRKIWLLLALLALLSGCTRAHYRRQADRDAVDLVREKANHPLWAIPEFNVYVDPQSRMFDPFNPDRPPLPPDDPAAHDLMHRVDGKPGYPRWHRNGDTPTIESPVWLDYLPMDQCGVLKLDMETIVEMGYVHSRTYQQEVEELYLSALDVSFERFRFDNQFFAGYQVFGFWDGKDRRGGNGQSRSVLTASTFSKGRNAAAWTMQRSFITGADLVVGFANTLVWQFSGPNDYAGVSLLDFSLMQPLLRNAGRARVLERLTRSERTLLSNVRAMQRYRSAFYLDLVTGRASQGDGPTRGGGVFGGSGLEGFTGVGGGGFGRVGATAANQGIGGGNAAGAGAGQAGGFIGLLQQNQQIRNQEDNIARLRANLYRLEVALQELLTTIPADKESIPRQRLQVAQARQALFVAESQLINSRNQFEGTLDNFKITLGLPPELCVELKDPMLDHFNLIDSAIKPRQDKIEEVIQKVGLTNEAILEAADEQRDERTGIIRQSLTWNDELKKHLSDLKAQLQPVEQVRRDLIEINLQHVVTDIERLREILPRRRTELERLYKKFDEQSKCVCPLLPMPAVNPAVFDTKRLDVLEARLEQELDRLRTQLEMYQDRMTELNAAVDGLLANGDERTPEKLFDEVRDGAVLASQNILSDMRLDILALELLQARARTEAIELVPVDLSGCKAMEIALKYRLDLMNARSSLVDSYRLIEFNANQLEGSLDIIFSGDVSNRTDNPLRLAGSTSRLRAGVQFDAPIVRLSERNTYRQALIEYQQARRNFYSFEDGIARNLRGELRQLETNQFNFELQRHAVLIAAEQIDLNEDIRVQQLADRRPAGATAARDSVSALSDLLNAQNNFLSIWVNYEVQRRTLDLDLGTMQLDEKGMWIDPGPIGEDYAAVVDARMQALGMGDCDIPLEMEELDTSRARAFQNDPRPDAGRSPAAEDDEEVAPLPSPSYPDASANSDGVRGGRSFRATPVHATSLSGEQSSRRRRNSGS